MIARDLTAYETEKRLQGYPWIAGVDEAGRGPLAGPVVAAACMMPAEMILSEVDDSKKLAPSKRAEIFSTICADPRIIYGVGIVAHDVIDAINIYQATLQAMLQAVSNLARRPDFLLVDGMKLPHPDIPAEKIIEGDAKVHCIAAASVIAKETRDQLMQDFHRQWPEYGFNKHKGYGTPQHLEALRRYGPCPIHRKSYAPVAFVCQQLQPVPLA